MQNSEVQLNQNPENSITSSTMPALADYMDYRLFLADFYRAKKTLTRTAIRPYSYALFSAAADQCTGEALRSRSWRRKRAGAADQSVGE